jgi:hypothetical protein
MAEGSYGSPTTCNINEVLQTVDRAMSRFDSGGAGSGALGAAVLAGATTTGSMGALPAPAPPPASSAYGAGAECCGNFGSVVGDSVCCGQAGIIGHPANICPASAPECKDFVQGARMGVCRGAPTAALLPVVSAVAAPAPPPPLPPYAAAAPAPAPPPATAAYRPTADLPLQTRLAALEKALMGKVQPGGVLQRIQALEKSVNGASRQGPLLSRLTSLESMLAGR